MLCRPSSVGILHSVSDQIQNLPNYFTTPNKMTSENDRKGLVSLMFLRPCLRLSAEDTLHEGTRDLVVFYRENFEKGYFYPNVTWSLV